MAGSTEQSTDATQVSAVLCSLVISNGVRGGGVYVLTSPLSSFKSNIVEPVHAEGGYASARYLLTTEAPLQSQSPRGLGAPGSSYTLARKR